MANGSIYVSGGNAKLDGGPTYSTAVERFDPGTAMWSKAASLPVGRNDHASVTGPDGKIYVLGGESDGSPPATTNAVDVYTPDP